MPSTELNGAYPNAGPERDRWILARRAERNAVDPGRPAAFLIEQERAESGQTVAVATVFLTSRECPWRCLMCDLWKNTLTRDIPPGAIPDQLDFALLQLSKQRSSNTPPLRAIKLYNSGSFFDPRAVPPRDYRPIADRVRAFERVIVECHPLLVGPSTVEFRDLLGTTDIRQSGPSHARPASELPTNRRLGVPALAGSDRFEPPEGGTPNEGPGSRSQCGQKLEVAMGLEIAHAEILEKLNKRMSLDQFRRAAEFLRAHQIGLRVFVLVQPPFVEAAGALHWARRSIDFAFDCGATVVSLIPTRLGNGALEALALRGEFSPPKISTLESALDYGIGLQRGRVFADVWDLEQFSECPDCLEPRRARLHEMNLAQVVRPPVECERCSRRAR